MHPPCSLLSSAYERTNSYFRIVKIIIFVSFLRLQLFYERICLLSSWSSRTGLLKLFPSTDLICPQPSSQNPASKQGNSYTHRSSIPQVSCHCFSHPQNNLVSFLPHDSSVCIFPSFKGQFIEREKNIHSDYWVVINTDLGHTPLIQVTVHQPRRKMGLKRKEENPDLSFSSS